MGSLRNFEDLIAWQKAYALVLSVYEATRLWPTEERFGLTQQVRRAAVSIPSNIAEGWGRQSRPDYIRFLRIARGSTFELQTQLRLAGDLGYGCPAELMDGLQEVSRLVNALVQSLERDTSSPNR